MAEQEYRTTCLLGCETDTYDSEGARVRTAPWKHVTREQVESALTQFCGEIQQTPPMFASLSSSWLETYHLTIFLCNRFSALKMDGMPLYEYARRGIPLPRPIESRKVTVHSLELVEWKSSDHPYRWPEKSFSEEEKKAMETALKGAEADIMVKDDLDPTATDFVPTAFVLKMKVSGGTYVRSIVHDLAHALGSAGHVVTLTRSRQGRFALESTAEDDRDCVPWDVFQRASADPGDVDDEGWTEWEREVLSRLEAVNGNK